MPPSYPFNGMGVFTKVRGRARYELREGRGWEKRVGGWGGGWIIAVYGRCARALALLARGVMNRRTLNNLVKRIRAFNRSDDKVREQSRRWGMAGLEKNQPEVALLLFYVVWFRRRAFVRYVEASRDAELNCECLMVAN